MASEESGESSDEAEVVEETEYVPMDLPVHNISTFLSSTDRRAHHH